MAVKEVTVTFNPPNEIIAEPEHTRVDWSKDDTVRWSFTSSDRGARIRGIDFEDHPQGHPFSQLGQHPSDPMQWRSGAPKKVRATFKYDIVVRDGEGNDVRLDPRITLGDPPA